MVELKRTAFFSCDDNSSKMDGVCVAKQRPTTLTEYIYKDNGYVEYA